MHLNCLKCMFHAFLPFDSCFFVFIRFIVTFACFMQLAHFTLDFKPLEHYFNSSITFQLEQPFNSIINTIGTRMNHAMSPGALFQWQTFKINSKT